MSWLDFIDQDNEEVLSFYLWLQGLAEVDQELVIGRIRALRELAAAGEIDEFDEESLVPIRRDPDLYELRWNELGTLIRQYHGEPPSRPEVLVNLHLHIKRISPTSEAVTEDLQNIEISHALMRYRGGESRSWQS
ncbi:hypothetical protein ABCS02_17205 [Microbacterium sp. X-17]|uniref:hypothetical protein n=1 Tax=Microbacterium sp. X-17 TaxID=3144404 RepID=UPI0031F50721